MFEHLKKKKQLKQQLSKVLSIALSVAMLVGTIPADMLGGIADVKAATGDGSVSATTYGDSFTSSVFAATGVDAVTNTSNDEEASSEQLYFPVNAGATIKFSVLENTAELSVIYATGVTNTLELKACDAEGNPTGDAINDWTSLAAGKYCLTASAALNLTSISLTHKTTGGGGTTVNATASVTFGNTLTEGNYTVKLKGQGDAVSEIKDIENKSWSGTLTKGVSYDVVCEKTDDEAADVSVSVTATGASVDGTTITVHANANDTDTVTIAISVTPASTNPEPVEADVTINVNKGTDTTNPSLVGLKLVCAKSDCENYSNNTEDVPLVNGEGSPIAKVNLKDGHQYKLADVPTGYTATITEATNGILSVTSSTTTITVNVTKSGSEDEENKYVLDVATLDTFNKNTKPDGTTQDAGDDNYFTIIYGNSTAINTNDKTWGDEYAGTKRINFGGAAAIYTASNTTTIKDSIKFSTESAANVKIWWVANKAARDMAIFQIDDSGDTATLKEITATAYSTTKAKLDNGIYLSTLRLTSAGEYYIGGKGGGNYVFKVEVTEGEAEDLARPLWSSVDDPSIGEVDYKQISEVKDSDGNVTTPASTDYTTICVPVTVDMSDAGGDILKVTMLDAEDASAEPVEYYTASSMKEYVIEFKPAKSGNYKFKAELTRIDDKGATVGAPKISADMAKAFEFTLPLSKPNVTVENKGATTAHPESGSILISWKKVSEATSYVVTVKEKNSASETPVFSQTISVTDDAQADYSVTVDENLSDNTEYTVSVVAKRGEAASEPGTKDVTVTLVISAVTTVTHVLDVEKDLNSTTDTSPTSGAWTKDPFFTVYYGTGSKIDTSKKEFDLNSDDKDVEVADNGKFTRNYRINFGGPHSVTETGVDNAIKFTTTSSSKVIVYWACGGAGRQVAILDDSGTEIAKTNTTAAQNTQYTSELIISSGGTYYLTDSGGKNWFFRVVVIDGYVAKGRPDWETEIDVPEIKGVAYAKKEVTAEDGTKTEVDDKTTLEVTVSASIGSEAAADKLEVNMYKYEYQYNEDGTPVVDEDGKPVYTISEEAAGIGSTEKKGESHVISITPNSSGYYAFVATISRSDEEKTYSSEPYLYTTRFSLPFATPTITNVTNKGNGKGSDSTKKYGSVEVTWDAVAEADYYLLKAEEVVSSDTPAVTDDTDSTSPEIRIPGTEKIGIMDENLEVGKKYKFSIKAVREKTGEGNTDEITENTYSEEVEITGKNTISWTASIYGDGTSVNQNTQTGEKYNGHKVVERDENDNPTKVTVWSEGGQGKIVPGSTDGVSFYYTTINPQTTNFKLTSDIHVDSWTLSNGQEGFGMLVEDTVGKSIDAQYDDGDRETRKSHWTNSYMALASKVEYFWSTERNKVSNAGEKVALKLGIGTTEKTGVTAANLPLFENSDTKAAATTQYFRSVTKPLDIQVHDGSYDNIIGNAVVYDDETKEFVPNADINTIPNPITDFRMSIELNATGYFISYTPLDAQGNVAGKKAVNKYYDRNALSKIEEDAVYVGFFASRNARATFSNIKLETSTYDPDEAPEERPVEEEDPKFAVSSAKTANDTDYTLIFEANWHGTFTLRDDAGRALARNVEIKGTPEESGKAEVPVKLGIGSNTFQISFTPDRTYDPFNGAPVTRLSSYAEYKETFTVTYKKYGKEGDAMYVSPKGKATGDGTKINPLDIYTAVKYTLPGQTIYLMEGTYNLTNTIKIDRGIDGRADAYIYMIPAPDAKSRPVLDFNGACAGMVLAGNYWYFKGFDVTRSSDGQKGIQVSGSYNTLDQINTYKNGNTGIQISRLLGSDLWDNWPSHNLILNCTSYLNADAGYEDADGFACKLTAADGNVFRGCVAAYNADDGWDLFAKVESGSIGDVEIIDCVAYKNGYVLRADNGSGDLAWWGDKDKNGNEYENIKQVNAGNGNGFKMGGSNMAGAHKLRNSLAFYNKAKGFDSNSGSNIEVYDSITYNNESFNVAFYSNASTTGFKASGLISYRTEGLMKEVLIDNKKQTVDTTTNVDSFEDRIGTWDKDKGSTIVNSQKTLEADIFNGTNYFWNRFNAQSQIDTDFYNNYTLETNKKATDKPASTNIVSNTWFEKLDFEAWTAELGSLSAERGTPVIVDRNANGSIKMNGFLELTDAGKNHVTNAGMGTGTGSKDDFGDVEETEGNIEQGDATTDTDTGVDPDDLEQMTPGLIDDTTEPGLWFAIVDKDLIEYTGKAIRPEVHVYSGTTLLTKKDYTITFKNNVNAWVAGRAENLYPNKVPTISVRGKGNYIGMAEDRTFEIRPVSLSGNLLDNPMNSVGAGDIVLVEKTSPQKVSPKVTFNNRALSSRNDYSFTIYNPAAAGQEATAIEGDKVTSAGAYTVKIKGKGNFTGERTINLNVIGSGDKDLMASSFKLSKPIQPKYRRGYKALAAGEVEPLYVELSTDELVIQDKTGKALERDKHYSISYKNNVEIGTATVIVTGKSYVDGDTQKAYYGSKEFTFRIIAPPLATLNKDGKVKFINTANISVNRSTGLISVKTTTESGTTTAAATDSNLTAFDFTNGGKGFDYQGKAVDLVNDYGLGLAIKRNDGNGDEWYLLSAGKDYKLSYVNNTRASNRPAASVIFKGIGSYSGSLTSDKFQINVFDLNDPKNLVPQGDATTSILGGTFEVKKVTNEGTTENVATMFTSFDGNGTYRGLTVSYEKGAVRPAVSLRINGNLLKAGKDYTITYRNNTKVSTGVTDERKMPTIIIRGINGLQGTLTAYYNIEPKNFASAEDKITITAQDIGISQPVRENGRVVGYTGSYKTRIVVKDAKGKKLSAGSDYDNNSVEYVLVDNLTHQPLKRDDGSDWVFGRNEKVPTITASEYLTVRVTVKAKENRNQCYVKDTEVSEYYRISYAKNSLAGARFTIDYSKSAFLTNAQKNAFIYNKNGVDLSGEDVLTVTLNNKPLEINEDFVFAGYTGNMKKGTAKLTIEGKNQYFGTKVITFRIVAKEFQWWSPKKAGSTTTSVINLESKPVIKPDNEL